MDDEFDAAHAWAETQGITPGHWPDADMLPLGIIGNRACAFTHNQQVTVLTLWSIMPSPLMCGGQPTRLAGDDWTIALLTNEEVLAVNQDALGSRGRRIAQQGSTEVWARDLSGGRKAVALFNRGSQDATMSVTFSELGVSGSQTVRDLWRKEDLTGATSEISVSVPYESALMYTVSPPDAGTGGAGGAGGATGSGGTAGTAGAGGSAGAPSGGSAGASVGGSGVGSGGAPVGSGGLATGGVSVGSGGLATGGVSVGSGGLATGGVSVGSGGLASGGASVGSGGTPVVGSGGTPVVGSGGTLLTGGTGAVDGSGGSPGVGGTLGAGGADLGGGGETPDASDGATDESGCGCRAAGKRPSSTPLAAALIFGLFALGARRRRRAPGTALH
jgi:MYXO-CTERM domain-containing protein